MKRLLAIIGVSVFVSTFASTASAVDYVLTRDTASSIKQFRSYATINYTSEPAIDLDNLPTIDDNVTLYNFTGIQGSGGSYGQTGETVINAKNLKINTGEYISLFYNGRSIVTADTMEIWNLDESQSRAALVLGGSASIARTTWHIKSADLRGIEIGNAGNKGTHNLEIASYSDTVESVINAGYFKFVHNNYQGSAASTDGILNINQNATLNVGTFTCDVNGVVETIANTSTLNVNGTLNIGSFKHNLVNDTVVFNINGTFGATGNIEIAPVAGGSITMNFGENAVIETNGNVVTVSSAVGNLGGSNGGFTVKKGGNLTFTTSVALLDGAIGVDAGSTLTLSDWVSSAESLTLGVQGVDDFAKIVLTDEGEVSGGNLVFNVNKDVLRDGNISISLNDIINGNADWNSFNITTNEGVNYLIDGSNIVFAVPEPAEWAAIFGMLSLGFAVYRRRK